MGPQTEALAGWLTFMGGQYHYHCHRRLAGGACLALIADGLVGISP
jgi:hypothetical protein